MHTCVKMQACVHVCKFMPECFVCMHATVPNCIMRIKNMYRHVCLHSQA